jgi:hypothetical protein
MVMSISTTGQWDYVVTEQPVDRNSFREYILGLNHPEGAVLIMDNVAFHKCHCVQEAMKQKGYVPLFIPPYCPDANPIEHVFGIIKNKFRIGWADARNRSNVSFDDVMEDSVETAIQQLGTFEHVFRNSLSWLQACTI